MASPISLKSNIFCFKEYKMNLITIFGFYYLVLVSGLGSTHFSIYYLLYNDRAYTILMFWRLLFLLCCVLQIIRPVLGNDLIVFLLQDRFVNYIKNRTEKISKIINKYEFFSIICFQLFLCLLLLHFLMLVLGELDVILEVFFQLFVLLRNFFLIPTLVYMYIGKFLLPENKLLVGVTEQATQIKTLLEWGEQLVDRLKIHVIKNPKTTGGMIAGTLALASAAVTGSLIKNEANAIQKASGITAEKLLQNPAYFLDINGNRDPEKVQSYFRLLDLQVKKEKSSVVIGMDSFVDLLKSDSSLLQQYNEIISKVSLETIDTAITEYQKQQALRGLEFMNTSSSRNATEEAEASSVAGSETLTASDSALIANSPLEKFIYFFQ